MPVPPYVLDARTPELVEGLARIREELDAPGRPAPVVLAEAQAAARRVLGSLEATIGRERVDGRGWDFVTIDPPGSRDLDQAVHLERRPGGGYRVRYAIADVAAFVTAEPALDADVWDRGVTLYLPDERAPLHPPVLGEGAGSLLPDEDRPALLWTIDLDRDGVAGEARLERAVVRSRAQLTYAGVQAALDGGQAGAVEQLLAEIGPLRQAIEAARGGVSLDLPTQRVSVDAGGYRLEREQTVPAMGWNAQLSLLAGMTAGAAMLEAGVGILRTLPPARDDVMHTVRRTAAALQVDWPADLTYAERVRTLDGDRPTEAALLVLAARGLRGAGYLALLPGEPVSPEAVVVHSAVAAPYAHVTAPLRRLADRYANEVCLALFDGGTVAPEVVDRLPDLPKAMAQAWVARARSPAPWSTWSRRCCCARGWGTCWRRAWWRRGRNVRRSSSPRSPSRSTWPRSAPARGVDPRACGERRPGGPHHRAPDGLMASAASLDSLRRAVGDAHVITDADLLASHEADWTGRWRGHASAVVRPSSAEEVQAIVALARAHGLALVPQGGNTGLVGGAVPRDGAIVVDLRRLDDLDAVDVAAAQVTVGAGVSLARLQAHVHPHGLAVPVDLAARDTATLGGMVATNAGGIHVVRHGSMRAQLLGVEAVLGTGEIVRANLAGLLKDNTGYDLVGLLSGSEGTLGIVTRLRLRLVPAPRARVVMLLGFPSVADALAALPALRARAGLAAVEMMRADGIQLVAAHLNATFPLAPIPACALLVELIGDDPEGEATALVASIDLADEATAVATEAAAATGLWRWREGHPEAAAVRGLVHKADVTLPFDRLSDFSDRVDAVVEAVHPGALTIVYGHLADGNLHVNVVGPPADDERPIDAVLGLVLQLGGSVSAEHGIGVAKRGWLVRQRGESAVAAMRAIKAALDPDGVLNPGVLLP